MRDTADANSPAPLEGLTQTDGSGRYRLELPAGRYYIASGSVSSPTYYLGTTDAGQAKLILVTAESVVEGIDFGSFVPAAPATRTLAGLPALGNLNALQGILTAIQGSRLSGTVRYPDGSPAVDVAVMAFSTAGIVPAGSLIHPSFTIARGQTDASGRYRLSINQADTYYIVAGFAEAPAFHTGDRNSSVPKTVTLTPAANVDALDVEIPRLATRAGGTTVRGRVTSSDGTPAIGATVTIASPVPTPMGVMGIRLPSAYPVTPVPGPDGTFEFPNVVPGFYNARVSLGARHLYESFELGNNPVELKFTLPSP